MSTCKCCTTIDKEVYGLKCDPERAMYKEIKDYDDIVLDEGPEEEILRLRSKLRTLEKFVKENLFKMIGEVEEIVKK